MAKQDADVIALADVLRTTIGCDDRIDRTRALEFWAQPSQHACQPPAINSADDYRGGAYLSINLSSSGLSPRLHQQRLQQWCELLPSFSDVEWLWVYGPVNPPIFAAICQLPKLHALCIDQSTINSLEPLAQRSSLQYLKIARSPAIHSIEPLAHLTHLKWLQLDQFKLISSLAPLQRLTQLEGFGFTGSDHKGHLIDSLQPLQHLILLRWLHLGALRVNDGSLQPLTGLQQLIWLGLPNAFALEEYAALSNHLSPEVCQWLQPYTRLHSSVLPCRICQKNWRVMMAGQGSKALCPSCHAIKLARHVLQFNQAKAAAAQSV